MKNTKIEYVPRMRFPEFTKTNSWKKFALKDITPCIFDGTHQTPNYVDTGIPFFSVENIISHVKNKYISEDDHFSNTIKNKPEKYDIILTRIGNIGFSKVVTWNYEFSIYVTLAIIKKSNLFDSFFLHYFIQSQACQNEIMRNSLLDAVPCKINLNDLKSIPILLPSTQEQQKIADCLSSLDELIEAHEQKRDALVEHKKGLMQRLFPAEGETTPRWRFPEFRKEKAWSVLTFEECCNKIMDGTHFSPKTKNGDFMYLSSRNIKDGKIDLTNVEKISLAEHKKIYEKCPVKRGDILLTKDGANTGNCAINTLDCEFSLLSSVAVLRVNNKILYNSFFYHGISTEYFKKMIKNSMFGQAITRITLEKISQFKISFPALPEQQKIADCLSSLDARIEAEEAKIASLREHKRGLMQRLFPQSL